MSFKCKHRLPECQTTLEWVHQRGKVRRGSFRWLPFGLKPLDATKFSIATTACLHRWKHSLLLVNKVCSSSTCEGFFVTLTSAHSYFLAKMSSPVFAVQMVKPVMVHKATKCLLTCNNPGRDEQLVDGLSK